MGRCKKCDSCLLVLEFKNNNKGKQNLKKYKRFDTANPCTNPTAKRARISETEKLFAGGHGGQIRGEIQPVPSVEDATLERADREARPKGSLMEDDPFNQEAFDEYLDLVNKCTQKAKQSTSADVKAEASSMIRKMRGLLHPSVKSEVDYAEATKDTSNILVQWSHGYAAGAKAFIPDLGDRDLCYAALKILSCAAEEAKQIPEEFVGLFDEDDGVGIYNELVGLIGEEEKHCLPLVNLCLRAWMRMLSEDLDLWSDSSPLDFDKGVEAELARAKEHGFSGKTSYEMMMAVFGDKSQENSDVKRSSRTTEVNSSAATSSQARKTVPTKTPWTKDFAAGEPAKKPVQGRKSKLQSLGEVVRKALHRSSVLRGKYRYTTQANEVIAAVLKDSSDGKPNERALRSCRYAARQMEDILFSAGGAERLVATFRYFKDRPAIRELGAAREILLADNDEGSKDLNIYFSKEERLNASIVSGLKVRKYSTI